jgi:HSP20 family molecular chaperone IbpA
MASSTMIPVVYTQHPADKYRLGSPLAATPASNRYSIQDHGQGYRTYSYEFDLFEYEPEQIDVLLDNCGTLRIRAHRPPFHEFRREYNLGGSNVETTLVRNTIDTRGHLRVDIDVTVRINRDGLLKINGQHHDQTFGNHINREYYRQYQLPSNVDPDQVRARMDANQILIIDLPTGSPTRTYTKGEYWVPVYERSHPGCYGTAPYAGYCCCNLM